MAEFLTDLEKGTGAKQDGHISRGSGIQRKNLMHAKILDTEVQQEIFPSDEGDGAIPLYVTGDKETTERVRYHNSAVQDMDSALGDLSNWRINNSQKMSSNFASNLLDNDGDSDKSSARLVAFINQELSSGQSKVADQDAEQNALSTDLGYMRLKALMERSNDEKKSDDSRDSSSSTFTSNLLLSNAEVAQMQSTNLGKQYTGKDQLEATRDALLAELEADDDAAAAMLKLQKQLENDQDLEDIILGYERK